MKDFIAKIIIILLFPVSAYSQVGGGGVYDFVNFNYSSLSAALGGKNVSLSESYSDLAYNNPALLNPSMNKQATLSFTSYVDGINYGMASYTGVFKEFNYQAGLIYLNFGNFPAADEYGVKSGEFGASEQALFFSISKQIKNYSIGFTIMPIISSLESYTSVGVLANIGFSYKTEDKLRSFGVSFKNIGRQISSYSSNGSYYNMPFEILAGASIKLSQAPLRFSVTLHQLQKWDITYSNNPDETDATSTSTIKESDFIGKIARHLIAGVEILPTNNFYVAAGYNFQRSAELGSDTFSSYSGFTWGLGLNLSKFAFHYSGAYYHLSGRTAHFTLTLKLNNIIH